MIVYSATKQQFQEDVMTNDIAGIVATKLKEKAGHGTGLSEFESWRKSLQYMDRVLSDTDIPADSGVAIEYHIPPVCQAHRLHTDRQKHQLAR